MSASKEVDDLEDCNTESHKRIIIHVDMDYFYAQVEEIRDPSLRNKPVGIKQRFHVVTSNYTAREYGITKMMLINEAKKLCPNLILINGEDLTNYREMSTQIFEVLQTFTPLVEKLGFDENYLDVTEVVNQRLNENVNNEVQGCIYPHGGKLDICGCGCTPKMVVATNLAKEIRDQLYKTLGITCCAGVAHNKLLAKLVGSMNKPNNQTVLVPTFAVQFMRNLNSLSKITGIGQKTEHLLNETGIRTINDLQNYDFDILKKKVGIESAQRLKDLSFGRDLSEVRPTGKPKSIGLEDSCEPISVRKDVEERFGQLLIRLVGQISNDGRIPITIKIIVRKYDAKNKISHRESKQANILSSLFKYTNGGEMVLADGAQEMLLKTIMRLFERTVDMKKPFNITLLGIAFLKFQERKIGSSSIANFLIKKPNLGVQSVTSLKSEGTECGSQSRAEDCSKSRLAFNSQPPAEPHAEPAEPPSVLKSSMDFESFSNFSDASDTEVEPLPKKSRLSPLIFNLRSLSSDVSDMGSPTKLKVAALQLDSTDSERDFDSPATASAATALHESHPNKRLPSLSDVVIDSPARFIDSGNSTISNSSSPTREETMKRNLTNIPCPSGVDPEVFKELPPEVQNELISSWRNSITTKARNQGKNGPTRTSTSASRNTLHRYFETK